MVTGWVLAAPYNLNLTAIALAGLATLMITGVLTPEDMGKQGGTLVTFIWLAILFGMSGQLNEMGFMGYVGERLAVGLEGLAWPVAYVALLSPPTCSSTSVSSARTHRCWRCSACFSTSA
jgi:DASS family divalent anion:Na+ symporter